MKHGNMRSYGTILTGKLVDEKCTDQTTPCVRYFIDKDGERITNPEEFTTGKDAFITPTEYRKRVDNVKRDKAGKFAKLEATYKAVTEVDEGAVLPSDVTEQALETSKEDEGGIVKGVSNEGLETVSVDKFPCLGECEGTVIECKECESIEACRVVTNNLVKETKDELDLELFDKVMSEIHQTDYPEQYEIKDEPKLAFCSSIPNGELTSENLDKCMDKLKELQEMETKDDLEGLAEPEPAWDYHLEERINEVISDVDNDLKSAIEKMWSILKQDAKIIRKMYITQAEQEFSEKFNQILGATK